MNEQEPTRFEAVAMKAENVSFEEVFHSLPEAVAVCDDGGEILSLNRRAKMLLGVDEADAELRLNLTDRETVRQMRVTLEEADGQEFFLADVRVEGAQKTHASVSLKELDGGGYRVVFSPAEGSGRVTPNVRILQGLVNAGRHLDLFKSGDKVLALFGASLADVFPDYSFRVWVAPKPGHRELTWQHEGWSATPRRAPPSEIPESGHVSERLLWEASRSGYRLSLADFSELSGYLQVERRDADRFGVDEREAFETFVQQLGFALGRVRKTDDLQAVAPIIDQLDAVVIICDARRRILVSNKTFETLVGSDGVTGDDILDYLSVESAGRLRTAAAAVMAGGEPESFEAHLEATGGEGESQSVLNLQVAPNRTTGDAQGGDAGFIITGQQNEVSIVELEERLTRAEHLMNLGELATGVAHELKNPLTSILNYADYLMHKYQDSLFEDRDSERLQRIIDGVERMDAFIRDLMSLARPDSERRSSVELRSTIEEAATMCELPVRQNSASVTFDFESDSLVVMGVRSQIKQVFVNLIANAAKAMPESGGSIYVEGEVQDAEVVCRVSDDAEGMSDETMSQIFEPFFTTREGEDGSGLGLAIVRNIVERHGGRISVDSTPGEGTTFTLRFPRGDD